MGHECDVCEVKELLETILQRLDALSEAFPVDASGRADIAGHRRYHDAKIAAAKAEEAFWRELRLELAKKGAWALLLVVIGLFAGGVIAYLRPYFR